MFFDTVLTCSIAVNSIIQPTSRACLKSWYSWRKQFCTTRDLQNNIDRLTTYELVLQEPTVLERRVTIYFKNILFPAYQQPETGDCWCYNNHPRSLPCSQLQVLVSGATGGFSAKCGGANRRSELLVPVVHTGGDLCFYYSIILLSTVTITRLLVYSNVI